MDSQWDDMKVFLAVARNESLSGAGRVLKVDPATVGRRIARLEESLKVALFAKSPQGYALTNEGQRLMSHATRAEQEMLMAFEDVGERGRQLSGQIRLGAPDGSANFLLPQVCAGIVEQNPDLEVQIVALPRVINLSKREADMAIAVSAPTAGRLSVQKITDYKLHLTASRNYLKSAAPIRTRDDLRHHRFVGYIQDMIFDKELDYLGEAGLDKVHLASNSVSVQFNWIRQAAGIGFMHDFAIPFSRGLQKVLTDEISLTRSFYLVRHAEDRRLERMNRFAEALATGIRKEVARLEGQT
ncbi:LysR family transcriptional regulator [Pseudohalocynthiibacter aestuariivivens]|uniref:LysR family transcriptional regulator n=1 Tax=Roseovarius pelagicus TaxID=2980108 RepID=A0ABY6DBH5_9RHOB|nr:MULTISPECIES: LysR family transcriptional regulator [Rhodobacterales]QIE44607.1 LysR family transcriptional regulator [Pseudohalocynthiibacter aestuariivivens]UXX83491.1 LysR family transcriptional regulator [Roseovarius pelagicus]